MDRENTHRLFSGSEASKQGIPDQSFGLITLLVAMISITAFSLILVIRSVGLLEALELRVYDAVMSATAVNVAAPDVITIAIEERDILDWGWPLTDARLAEIVSAVGKGGAIAIGLDIYRDHSVPPGATDLSRAFADFGAVSISKLASDETQPIAPPDFVRDSGRYGYSDMPLDPDGTVRRALLLVSDENGVQLSFALRLALAALGDAPLAAWAADPTILAFGDNPVPPLRNGFGPYVGLDDAGYQVLIDYRNRLPITRQFSARDMLSGKVSADAIKGKIAIIGNATDSVKDYFRTPLNGGSQPMQSYGIQLHAAVVQQILDYAKGHLAPVRGLPPLAQTLLILTFSVIGALLARKARTLATATLLGPVLGLIAGGAMAATWETGLWLPSVPTTGAFLLSFFLMYSVLAVIARREQQQVFQLFSSHLSPNLTKQIWSNRKSLLSGGKPIPQRLFVTILFADLAGSTRVGGSADPIEYMDWISQFLAAMSEVAQVTGGFVEKYTGDGIMVVFGAPMPSLTGDDHQRDAQAACRCAMAMSDAIDRLNQAERLLAPYRSRIGLHSGFVFGGTIGTFGSLRYNIIGDCANVAARVEAFGKRIQSKATRSTIICLTHRTAGLAGQTVDVAPIGTLTHDDGNTELAVFELVELVQN